ncbi:MAG: hypothetical protein ACI945_000996 [Pseudohongiellaceae bacterium]|jgi:uncharacterized protein YehS (DUF1456 family)
MTGNDCLRRIRYILDLDDRKMISVFAEAQHTVTREEISAWLKKDDDPDYELCNDTVFALFLNGLINLKRGKKDGVQPEPEKRLTNNTIFRKLKIAFNLQAEEILSILALADLRISKHELSAFFRRADHKHYRECKDQILRNFLMGMQIKLRGKNESESDEPEESVYDLTYQSTSTE